VVIHTKQTGRREIDFTRLTKDNPLVLHVLETAPSRVAAPEFDWAPLGPLLAAAGHPCAQIQIVLVSPHIEQRLHATTRVFHQAHGADCGPVTLRYHKNFYDNSAELRPLPAGATEAEAAAGGRDKADMVVWLNVDAYMCAPCVTHRTPSVTHPHKTNRAV
jgi:hypothetical protein